jgi:hypothetical protein
MEPVSARRTFVTWAVIVLFAAALIGGALFLARERLFGTGPDAIHPLSLIHDRISACGRHYHGGDRIRSLRDIEADGLEPVLVDPAPFAPCPPATIDGIRPCNDPNAEACATVVYVRVGVDAYATYELVGGP